MEKNDDAEHRDGEPACCTKQTDLVLSSGRGQGQGNEEPKTMGAGEVVTVADEELLARLNPSKKKRRHRVHLRQLARVASIAVGIQFGWALQLSLLTPFIQELGIPHAWASYIWLCGPITGLIVQPMVGVWSDKCELAWGRRRPFMVAGAAMACLAVVIIGFSTDLGRAMGDPLDFPSKAVKWNAVVVFIVGFWLLDFSNNTVQGPCRALLADLTGKEVKRTRRANSYFSAFMAVGSVMGFITGAYPHLGALLPFMYTDACRESCANLKAAFLLHAILLGVFTALSVTAAREISLLEIREQKERTAALVAGLLPSPLPLSLDLESTKEPRRPLPCVSTPLLKQSLSMPGLERKGRYGTYGSPLSPVEPKRTARSVEILDQALLQSRMEGLKEALVEEGEGEREEESPSLLPSPDTEIQQEQESLRTPLLSQEQAGRGGPQALVQAQAIQPSLGYRLLSGALSLLGFGDLLREDEEEAEEESRGTSGQEEEHETAVPRGSQRDGVAAEPAAEEGEGEGEGEGEEEGEHPDDTSNRRKIPLWSAVASIKVLPIELLRLLLVTSLTWLSLFPFFLFDTDFMGREVFGGSPDGTAAEAQRFHDGVRWGAFGLALNSLVQGSVSLLIDPAVRIMGSRTVWALGNLTLALCMGSTAAVGLIPRQDQPNRAIPAPAPAPAQAPGPAPAAKALALLIFAVLGGPLAVTYSLPFSLVSAFTHSQGGGQGAAMGVLNLSVVVPQMLVSASAGPIDAYFGGGNMPAFLISAAFAAAAAVAAQMLIPRTPTDSQSTFHLTRTLSNPLP